MKASTFGHKDGLAVRNSTGSKETAFTLIELMVVIATMAVLAVMLLPALAGTQAQSKVTACGANFRQWAASANLYANDNQGWLPNSSLTLGTGGLFAWDVGTNMLDALHPYGMNVPDYFCPMRPAEWDAANAWGQAIYLGHPIQNISDLRLYFSRGGFSELVLNYNYWLPRSQGTMKFPTDWSLMSPGSWPIYIQTGMPSCATYGWPQRLHDIAATYVPFVSDTAGSGNGFSGLISPVVGPNVTNISPNTAHFVNGKLIGVNLAFADGHVAGHSPSQMRCVYQSPGSPYWFY